MGILKSFYQKYVKSGYTDALDAELDEIRSEYPLTLASGYHSWAAGSVINTSLLLVPSTKQLHMKNLMINNQADEPQMAFFFDGPGTSVPVGGIHVNRSTTLFIDEANLRGWIFQSAIHASLATSLTQVRVGTLIRTST